MKKQIKINDFHDFARFSRKFECQFPFREAYLRFSCSATSSPTSSRGSRQKDLGERPRTSRGTRIAFVVLFLLSDASFFVLRLIRHPA